MAHYAWLDENNIVLNVQNGMDETELLNGEVVDWEEKYLEIAQKLNSNVVSVKRTSYNTYQKVHINNETGEASDTPEKSFRGNYATKGGKYLPDKDIFVPVPMFSSWVLNEENATYEPPVPIPDDHELTPYHWDEETTSWVEGDYDEKPNHNYT
jgi:hypothetical protein